MVPPFVNPPGNKLLAPLKNLVPNLCTFEDINSEHYRELLAGEPSDYDDVFSDDEGTIMDPPTLIPNSLTQNHCLEELSCPVPRPSSSVPIFSGQRPPFSLQNSSTNVGNATKPPCVSPSPFGAVGKNILSATNGNLLQPESHVLVTGGNQVDSSLHHFYFHRKNLSCQERAVSPRDRVSYGIDQQSKPAMPSRKQKGGQESKSSACPRKKKGIRKRTGKDWSEWLKEAKCFVQDNGHCVIPHNYPKNQELAHWAKRQRYQYSKKFQPGNNNTSSLTQERIQDLNKLGFCWSLREDIWSKRFDELCQFCEENGHANVTGMYKKNQKLAGWVKGQRHQYKLWKSGEQTAMNEARVNRLESIGFEWIRTYPPTTERQKEDWNSSLGLRTVSSKTIKKWIQESVRYK